MRGKRRPINNFVVDAEDEQQTKLRDRGNGRRKPIQDFDVPDVEIDEPGITEPIKKKITPKTVPDKDRYRGITKPEYDDKLWGVPEGFIDYDSLGSDREERLQTALRQSSVLNPEFLSPKPRRIEDATTIKESTDTPRITPKDVLEPKEKSKQRVKEIRKRLQNVMPLDLTRGKLQTPFDKLPEDVQQFNRQKFQGVDLDPERQPEQVSVDEVAFNKLTNFLLDVDLYDKPIADPIRSILQPLFGGKEKIDQGAWEMINEGKVLKGAGRFAGGVVQTSLNLLPALIGLNASMPLVNNVGEEIAVSLGSTKEKGREIASHLAPFIFGKWVGAGSLASWGTDELIKDSPIIQNLEPEDQMIARELLGHLIFFGTIIGGKKLQRDVIDKKLDETFPYTRGLKKDEKVQKLGKRLELLQERHNYDRTARGERGIDFTPETVVTKNLLNSIKKEIPGLWKNFRRDLNNLSKQRKKAGGIEQSPINDIINKKQPKLLGTSEPEIKPKSPPESSQVTPPVRTEIKPFDIPADPRSGFIVNQVGKKLEPLFKGTNPIDEKIITDQIDEIIDSKQQEKLGELYNKVLEHNKKYPKVKVADEEITKKATEEPTSENIPAEEIIEPEPSDAQKDAGNYKMAHINKDGFEITIENIKGSERSGKDDKGKEWSVTMENDYGYIRGTVGKDKDHLDVFLDENYTDDANVFVVNQTKPDGKFDEHKVMMGFDNLEEAEKGYLSNYEKGWDNYSDIVEMPMDQFKEWSKDPKLTKKEAEEVETVETLGEKQLKEKPKDKFKAEFEHRRDTAVKMIANKENKIKELKFVNEQWAKDDIKRIQNEINEYYKDYPNLQKKKSVKKKEKPAETGKPVAATWQEAVLEYLVQGGKVKDGVEDYVPKNLRELGLSNRNISKEGTPFDVLISHVGFADLIYKTGESERDLVRDLLYKYDSHEKRVAALKELREGTKQPEPGEAELEKFERYEAAKPKLDEIILNEYMNPDGELQINDIIKDSDKISNRANVDDDGILKYLKEKEQELSQLDESAFDDVFGEFETEEITNERRKEIVRDTDPEELDKLAEDITSKAESEKETDLNEAIGKADELILKPTETKKITDRVDKIEGVEKTYWDGENQKLTVYFDEDIPMSTIQVRVGKELSDNQLLDAVENVTYLSTPTGTFEKPEKIIMGQKTFDEKQLQEAKDKLAELESSVFASDQEKKLAAKELRDIEAKYAQEELLPDVEINELIKPEELDNILEEKFGEFSNVQFDDYLEQVAGKISIKKRYKNDAPSVKRANILRDWQRKNAERVETKKPPEIKKPEKLTKNEKAFNELLKTGSAQELIDYKRILNKKGTIAKEFADRKDQMIKQIDEKLNFIKDTHQDMFGAAEVEKQRELFAIKTTPEEKTKLYEDIRKYEGSESFNKDYEILYHGGSEKIIGDKLSTGARIVGEITSETLGKGQDAGGVFFTPEKQLAETFAKHSTTGTGKVHLFLVKTKDIFDVRKPKHLEKVKKFVGKKYKDVDGYEETFTKQHFDFMFNKDERGKLQTDWATYYPEVLEQLGFKGAKVVEKYEEDGDHLYSTVLFQGGKNSPHWLIQDNDTIVSIYNEAKKEESFAIKKPVTKDKLDDLGNEIKKDLLPMRAFHLDNPVMANVALHTWKEYPLYRFTKEDWLDKFGYVVNNRNFKLLKKGDEGYVEGQELYEARAGAAYVPTAEGGKLKLYGEATVDEYIHETIHHIQTEIQKKDPELQQIIEAWQNKVRKEAKKLGVDIPQKMETFRYAYMHYLGWENPIGNWFVLPPEIIEPVNKYAAQSNTGGDNLPALMRTSYPKKQIKVSGKPDTKGFTFESGKLDILSAQAPHAPPFFSKLQTVLNKKLPVKFHPAMVSDILKAGGIKEAEIKWSGIEEYIAEKKKAREKITKQEVLDFLKANELRIEEVEKESVLYEGQPLFSIKPAGQTNTPEFKNWFGKSKVVDEKGKPLVVYHGTIKDFEKFKTPTKTGKLKSPLGILGSYFTESPDLASDFTRYTWSDKRSPFKKRANVLPVYLKLEKPYKMSMDEFVQTSGRPDDVAKKLRQKLISKGYDGIIVEKPTEGYWAESAVMDEFPTNQYVAFKNTQIKSAIGNRGTFDPSEPGIMFSIKAEPESNILTEAADNIRKLRESSGQVYNEAMAEDYVRAGAYLFGQIKTELGEGKDLYPEWRRRFFAEFGKGAKLRQNIRKIWKQAKVLDLAQVEPKGIEEVTEPEPKITKKITGEPTEKVQTSFARFKEKLAKKGGELIGSFVDESGNIVVEYKFKTDKNSRFATVKENEIFTRIRDDLKMRKFGKRVAKMKQFEEQSKRIKKSPESYYKPQSRSDLRDEMAGLGEDALNQRFEQYLESVKGVNTTGVMAGLEMINRKIKAGEDPYETIQKLNKVGTPLGQLISQYAELKSSPAQERTLLSIIEQRFKSKGRFITDKIREQFEKVITEYTDANKKVQDFQEILENEPTLENVKKLNSLTKAVKYKEHKLVRVINRYLPREFSDIWIAATKAGFMGTSSLVKNPLWNIFGEFMPRQLGKLMITPIDYLHSKITKTPRSHIVDKRFYVETFKGGKEGLKDAWDVMLSGSDEFINEKYEVSRGFQPFHALIDLFSKNLPVDVEGKIPLKDRFNKLLEGTVGIPATAIFRGLPFGDLPFSEAVKRSTAYEQGKIKDLEGEEIDKFVERQDEKTKQLMEKEGRRSVFMQSNQISNFMMKIMNKLGEKPVYGGFAKILYNTQFPFFKAPTNALFLMIDYSIPVIPLSKSIYFASKANEGGENSNTYRRQSYHELSKVLIGGIMYAAAGFLADNDIISGEISSNKKLRNIQYSTKYPRKINLTRLKKILTGEKLSPGWQKDDLLVDYETMGGFGVTLMVMDSFYKKYGKEASTTMQDMINFTTTAFFGSLKFLANQSIAIGVQGLLGAILSDDENKRERFYENVSQALIIPVLPNELSAINRMHQEYIVNRKGNTLPETFLNSVEQKNPFSEPKNPVYIRDLWGRKVKRPGGIIGKGSNILYFFKARVMEDDPVTYEIYDIYIRTGDKDVIPPDVKDRITLNNETILFEKRDHEQFQELIGTERLKLAKQYIGSSKYSTDPDEKRIEELKSIYNDGYKLGKSKFVDEKGIIIKSKKKVSF